MLLAGVVVCGVATVVSIIGTAIPYWIYQHGVRNQGLWRRCVEVLSVTTCVSYGSDVADWLKAVQALMILGVLFLALSVLQGCLQRKYDSRQLFQCSVFTTLLGGLVIIIAVIIFGVKKKDEHSYLHAGFYLSLVGGLLAFFAAIMIGSSKRGPTGYSSL